MTEYTALIENCNFCLNRFEVGEYMVKYFMTLCNGIVLKAIRL
jgi:hypothetical protein